MGRGKATQAARVRSDYDVAVAVIERLRLVGVPMSPINFELWFRASQEGEGELSAAVAAAEDEGRAFSEAKSEALAARFLPEHRLAREARESSEELALQLDTATRALVEAQLSQKTYGLNLQAGAVALDSVNNPTAMRHVINHLASATAKAQHEAAQLGEQLATATAEVAVLKEHVGAVRHEALTDELTGLPNRRAFDIALTAACAAGESVTVALIDVDHFKRFNDSWGHATGDQVLKLVADMVGRAAPSTGVAARYGGEEFAILFPEAEAPAAIASLDRMQAQIRTRTLTRRTTGERLGSLTVSIGLATRSEEGCEELMSRADEALYVSKRGGRDRLTRAESHAAAPRPLQATR